MSRQRLSYVVRRLRSYYRTVRDSLRYEGPGILVWRIVVKLVSPVLRVDHQILFEIDLTKPIEQRRARVECVIEPATEADIDQIVDMQIGRLPFDDDVPLSDDVDYYRAWSENLWTSVRDSSLQALRAGEVCFVARVDGRIAHSNWTRFHWCGPVPHRPVHLEPGEIYTTDGFTADEWRGKALHEAVLTHMLRYAQHRGCTWAYTITDLVKAGSRRGVLRVGWKQRGHLLYLSLRGLDRTWVVRVGGDVEPMLRVAREAAAPP